MATLPRKFSEKIALHNQKQAEGDAAFHQIMREVTDVTSNVDSNTVYRERGRSLGSGGPMRSRPVEKRVDTSPYSCGPYLSPPSADLIWRRTNSDSALHQSVQNPQNTLHSPGSQRRANALENQQHYDSSRTKHLSVSTEKRPRSCCEVPTSIPDINIYPSQQEPGIIQIPICNNTGSLPDLTNIVFTSPIHTPLDQEDHQSSTYSSVKHLSVPLGNSGYLHTPKGYLDGSPVETNGYQIQPQISSHHQQQSLHKQTSQIMNIQQQHTLHQSQQQLSQNHQAQMQPQRQAQYTYQQTSSPQRQSSVSPVDVPGPESIVLNHKNSMTLYRSQSNNKQSPQSSPTLSVKSQQYSDNASPLSSAPQSPTSSCNSVNSNNQHQSYNSSSDFYVAQAQETLQQHFEQIRMLGSPVSSTAEYIMPIPNGTSGPYQQSDSSSNELTVDQGYYSTSPTQQLAYGNTLNSAQTTPNTPTSIPDIVFSDYSTNEDETISRDATKDFSCDISNFLPTDDGLRDDLSSIDLLGLTHDMLGSDSSHHLYNSL